MSRVRGQALDSHESGASGWLQVLGVCSAALNHGLVYGVLVPRSPKKRGKK